MQKPGAVQKSTKLKASMLYPVAILAFSTLIFGVFGGWFLDVLQDASEMLMQPDIYIRAVLK